MFKLKAHNGYIKKSYNIYDLWMLIVSHPDWQYQFFIDYSLISTDDFLKYFISETKSFKDYQTLYKALKPHSNIQQWLEKNKH